MKKYITGIVLLGGILIQSCSDAYEIEPQNSITGEVAFLTVSDMELGLNGVYDIYDPEGVIAFSSIFTDDTKIGEDNAGQNAAFHNFLLDAGTGQASRIWNGMYNLINSASRVIEASENIMPADNAEQARYNFVLGQCYAIRALAHLHLMTFYSTDYQPETPAVPYIDGVNVFEEPARNTVAEVSTGITADLDRAENLIPDGFSDINYLTQDGLTAIRARLALYTGDYAAAEGFAGELIDNYELAGRDPYFFMFVGDTDVTEVIFKVKHIPNIDNGIGFEWFTNIGGSYLEVSNELVQIADQDDGFDIRRFVVYTRQDAFGTEDTQERVNKYTGAPDGVYGVADVKIFRVSEMYLIRAEARARQDNLLGAAQDITALRNARFSREDVATPYSDFDTALTAILAERRLELCFEGHRYIDIKRTRDFTGTGIVRSAELNDCGPGTGTSNCVLAVGDYRFTLPIPATELDGNGVIQQNPGY
ncbi:MAG: RagB/SusD family nutrient uptake outer membrane protein [Pricia sp.]